MRKYSQGLVSLAVVLICAFVLPYAFGSTHHRYHADHVRRILSPALTMSDGQVEKVEVGRGRFTDSGRIVASR